MRIGVGAQKDSSNTRLVTDIIPDVNDYTVEKIRIGSFFAWTKITKSPVLPTTLIEPNLVTTSPCGQMHEVIHDQPHIHGVVLIECV